MKIIIDIPQDVYVHGKRYQRPNDVNGFVDVMLEGLAKGVSIPDDATNGDVITTLFPNADISMANYVVFVRYEENNIETPVYDRYWWDSKYKGGE